MEIMTNMNQPLTQVDISLRMSTRLAICLHKKIAVSSNYQTRKSSVKREKKVKGESKAGDRDANVTLEIVGTTCGPQYRSHGGL